MKLGPLRALAWTSGKRRRKTETAALDRAIAEARKTTAVIESLANTGPSEGVVETAPLERTFMQKQAGEPPEGEILDVPGFLPASPEVAAWPPVQSEDESEGDFDLTGGGSTQSETLGRGSEFSSFNVAMRSLTDAFPDARPLGLEVDDEGSPGVPLFPWLALDNILPSGHWRFVAESLTYEGGVDNDDIEPSIGELRRYVFLDGGANQGQGADDAGMSDGSPEEEERRRGA